MDAWNIHHGSCGYGYLSRDGAHNAAQINQHGALIITLPLLVCLLSRASSSIPRMELSPSHYEGAHARARGHSERRPTACSCVN